METLNSKGGIGVAFLSMIFWFFVGVWAIKACVRSGRLVSKGIDKLFDKLEGLFNKKDS